MYEFLRGELMRATPPLLVLDVGGVGYRLHAPLSLFSKLGTTRQTMTLYTSLVVRDNGHQLYGFLAANERDLFDQLLGVSGIGPKLALSLLGHLTSSTLKLAVAQGDWKTLATSPGVGRKTAERLIVELRGRLSIDDSGEAGRPPLAGDAIAALVHLGYPLQTARQAVDEALRSHPAQELGSLITIALRCLP
jgi:holliday junction DNA helicase RuvA